MTKEERLLYMLIQALQLLASDYLDQVGSLPGFVSMPDELSTTYGDCVLVLDQIRAAGLISEDQVKRITELDEWLQQMDADKSLYSLEALKDRPEWRSIRAVAENILSILGVPQAKT